MNIGYFKYTKHEESGALFCDWSLNLDGKFISGTGETAPTTNVDFSGEYVITYTHDTGYVSEPYTLIIRKQDNDFSLKWFQDDVLKCIGLGTLHDNMLIGGWRNVTQKHTENKDYQYKSFMRNKLRNQ